MLRSGLRWLLKIIPKPWQKELIGELGQGVDTDQLANAIRQLMLTRAEALPADEALRFLFRIDTALYAYQGRNAVRYGEGVHVKHRLMNYHQFFIDRIQPGNRVLDIGCGNGTLTRNMAEQAQAILTGIDIKAENINTAQKKPHPLVTYQLGDVTTTTFVEPFEIITLSNVLEHLPNRPEFLRRLIQQTAPKSLLIRVPLFDREWRVPLKKELGVEWRLDSTHETEYSQESFAQEMASAGLIIQHQEIRWGEIWAQLTPMSHQPTMPS